MNTQSFVDLGVLPVLCKGLAARGIDAPFTVQPLVIPDVLAGRDVLVKSPTGSGKTLAFGLPIVEIVKTGPAELTIGNAINFGGTFTVNAGRLNLQGPVSATELAANSGGNIHDIARTVAHVLVLDRMDNVGVPEDSVTRLHKRNGG